jgi:hypothetical protein
MWGRENGRGGVDGMSVEKVERKEEEKKVVEGKEDEEEEVVVVVVGWAVV